MTIDTNSKARSGVSTPDQDVLKTGKSRTQISPMATAASDGRIAGPRHQRSKRTPRDLSDGLPPYSTVTEFAAVAHVHPRTITRDIDDGLLIATNFRGARRISREDGRAYLRKMRSSVGHAQRRRSPVKSPNDIKTNDTSEST